MRNPEGNFKEISKKEQPLIEPFLRGASAEEKKHLIKAINLLLMMNQGSLVRSYNLTDRLAYSSSVVADYIKKALIKGEIDSSAPWFKELEDKIYQIDIYKAGSIKDLKKGGEDFEIKEGYHEELLNAMLDDFRKRFL